MARCRGHTTRVGWTPHRDDDHGSAPPQPSPRPSVSVIAFFDGLACTFFDCLVCLWIGFPTRLRVPSCSRPSRTLRAAGAVARRRAILDCRCARRLVARAGRDGRMVPDRTKGWRLPGSASRAPHRFWEVEVCPSVSEVRVLSVVTIQISFRSVFHRPSFFPVFELVWRK